MAMAYTQSYPQRVSRLILSNLAPNNSVERQRMSQTYFDNTAAPERKNHFEIEMAKALSAAEKDPKNRFTYINIGLQAQSFFEYDYDGSYLWEGVPNYMPALDYLWGEAFARFDTVRMLSTITCPVTLALGKYDYLAAPFVLWQPILIQYPKIKCIIFQQSGHNPMFEEAGRYLWMLEKFA